jgi:3-hydroxyisobutyrate dehydrogenase-like beta-hydroxyacid dehydrogenase
MVKIGFIGLGTMGSRIALNLRQAGHQVVVNDARKDAASPHIDAGCEWSETPRLVAEQSEVVFTSLPGPDQVEHVGTGPAGLIEGMSRGSAWFDLSTNSPTVIRRLHRAFAANGVAVLDAPVSGGPDGASKGTLALWVGGDKAQYDRFRPVIDVIGSRANYIGEIGSGSIAKLVHNAAGYVINTALAEVFTAGVKAGIPPLELWAAVREGALGRMRTFDTLGRHFLPQQFDPPAFALNLAHKDVRLMSELAREVHVPMRLVNATLEEMTEALNRGWEGRDSRVAMMLQVERSGLEPDDMKCTADEIDAVRNPG